MAIPHHADPDAAERLRNARELGEILGLLGCLAHLRDGFPVDQLTHSLQTADRAQRNGADPPVIAIALLHDVGKVLSETNHPAIAAEIVKDRVHPHLYHVLRTHGEFQDDRNHGTSETRRYDGESWYGLALHLAEWDHASFDPDFPTLSLSFFLPHLRQMYLK